MTLSILATIGFVVAALIVLNLIAVVLALARAADLGRRAGWSTRANGALPGVR